MITVDNIYKKYGSREVLKGVSLKADAGQIVSVIGRNGCGKSTLLQIMAGALKPDSGQISLFNKDPLKERRLFGRFVGYVPQDDPLLQDLSVRDNLSLWASGAGDIDGDIIDRFDLRPILKDPVRTLSGGMKRRLSIACAMQRKTPVVILDEPTTSLDIYYQDSIRDWMLYHASHNGIVIMATHNEQEILASDRVYILDNGVAEPLEGDINMNEIRERFLISDR